jgi:hypothetical protein
MSDPLSAGEPGAGATSAQLQHDIDTGRTGDKVGGFDPAAAPLGTDEEAAGEALSPEEIARSRVQERAAWDTARANAATPELAPDGRIRGQSGLVIAAAAGAGAGIVLALLLAAL